MTNWSARIKVMNIDIVNKGEHQMTMTILTSSDFNKLHNMRRLLALTLAVGLIGCAQQPARPAGTAVTGGGYTYDRYARSAEVWGYANPVYKNWTTEQLQRRRLDLYATVPLARTANEVPAYIYSGIPLPQQDEIKAVEVELNRRSQLGDKAAEPIPFWPESRRHLS